jgi:hypothetical protein
VGESDSIIQGRVTSVSLEPHPQLSKLLMVVVKRILVPLADWHEKFSIETGCSSYPALSTHILSQTEQYGQRTSGRVKTGNPALSCLGFKPGLIVSREE